MTARNRMLARKLSIVVVLVTGLVLAAGPLGAEEKVYTNCYYGDDGNGNPTGVSSIAEGGSCAPGTSAECTGTMRACDRAVGFGVVE